MPTKPRNSAVDPAAVPDPGYPQSRAAESPVRRLVDTSWLEGAPASQAANARDDNGWSRGRPTPISQRLLAEAEHFDQDLGLAFFQIRQLTRLTVPALARALSCSAEVVDALEAGDVLAFPADGELARIVVQYGGFAGIDPWQLVTRIAHYRSGIPLAMSARLAGLTDVQPHASNPIGPTVRHDARPTLRSDVRQGDIAPPMTQRAVTAAMAPEGLGPGAPLVPVWIVEDNASPIPDVRPPLFDARRPLDGAPFEFGPPEVRSDYGAPPMRDVTPPFTFDPRSIAVDPQTRGRLGVRPGQTSPTHDQPVPPRNPNGRIVEAVSLSRTAASSSALRHLVSRLGWRGSGWPVSGARAWALFQRARRRTLGTAVLAVTTIGLYLGGFWPPVLYQVVALSPEAGRPMARRLVDPLVSVLAPRRQGLIWIDVGDPRLRKADRLRIADR